MLGRVTVESEAFGLPSCSYWFDRAFTHSSPTLTALRSRFANLQIGYARTEMWGTWTTTVASGILALMLLIGLLFSFAPVVLGVLLVFFIAAVIAAGFALRRAKKVADEGVAVRSRNTPPPRSELPQRPPSDEAMRAEQTPGKTG